MSDEPLPGGRSHPGEVFRRGTTLVRPVGDGAWVEVLRRINDVFDAAPRVIATVERTVLVEWQDGDAPQDLGRAPLSDLRTVTALGGLLRRLHDATAPLASEFHSTSTGLADPTGATEVICHGDPLPGNIVFQSGVPVALIDWEYAAPGRRAWDLAVAVRWWSPFRAPENLRAGEEHLDPAARACALLAGYGAEATLAADVAALMVESHRVAAANAYRLVRARGADGFRRWVERGGERRLEADRVWLSRHSGAVLAALTR